jgi:hypothetical protein
LIYIVYLLTEFIRSEEDGRKLGHSQAEAARRMPFYAKLD